MSGVGSSSRESRAEVFLIFRSDRVEGRKSATAAHLMTTVAGSRFREDRVTHLGGGTDVNHFGAGRGVEAHRATDEDDGRAAIKRGGGEGMPILPLERLER